MAIKKSELYSSLWQSCDELRGGNRRITAALLPWWINTCFLEESPGWV